MKTLSKKYRATIIDGTASEGWTEPCTGFTFAPDDVQCFEADTLQELQQLAASAGVTLDDGRVNVLAVEPFSAQRDHVEVSNAQFRSALILSGIMPSTVLASLQAIEDETQRELAIAKWEYANFVERDHPLIATMAKQFGLSDTQVDELFRVADKL